MFIRKFRAAAMTVAAASTLALAAAGAVGASVNTNAVETVNNGAAGYSVTNGNPFGNAGAQIVTHTAALNIGHPSGTSNTGGTGVQLCDPNNGFGGQLGEVSNGKTFDLEYAVGTLAGAATDSCVGNPLLSGAVHIHPTTLDGLAVGDQVDVFISFRNVRVTVRHPGHWTSCHRHGKLIRHCHWHRATFSHEEQGRMKFQAQDETAGFEVYASPWIHTAADWNLTEAGFGVEQETTGLSADTPITCPPTGNPATPGPVNPAPVGNACVAVPGSARYNGLTGPDGTGAHTNLVDIAGFVNGFGLALPPFSPPIAAYSIHEVTTTGNGLNTNPALVAPNSSITGSGLNRNKPCSSVGVASPGQQFAFCDYVGNVTH